MDSNKYIYATLLSTPKYLQGVKALYKSLCKYGKSKHPFVCFCSKDVPQYCIEELKWYGIECVCLPSYSLSTSLLEQVKTNKINHWIFTFDKLFAITSTLVCCVVIPDAAVQSALIIIAASYLILNGRLHLRPFQP